MGGIAFQFVRTNRTIWYCMNGDAGSRMARFGREDWLALGRAILATEGSSSLTIEALTARAGKTRGSFYHHFRDRAAFVAALAEAWAREVAETPPEATDLALERAMRALPEAGDAIHAADNARRAAFRASLPVPEDGAEPYVELALMVFLGAVSQPETSEARLAALLRLYEEMAAAHWNE